MFKKLRLVASLAALAALAAPAAATAGGSATPVSVDVSGTQTVVDEAAGTFAMQGASSAPGTRRSSSSATPRRSQFVATGKELFVGLPRCQRERRVRREGARGQPEVHVHVLGIVRPGDGRTAAWQLRAPDHRRQRQLPQGRRRPLHGGHADRRQRRDDLHRHDRVPRPQRPDRPPSTARSPPQARAQPGTAGSAAAPDPARSSAAGRAPGGGDSGRPAVRAVRSSVGVRLPPEGACATTGFSGRWRCARATVPSPSAARAVARCSPCS